MRRPCGLQLRFGGSCRGVVLEKGGIIVVLRLIFLFSLVFLISVAQAIVVAVVLLLGALPGSLVGLGLFCAINETQPCGRTVPFTQRLGGLNRREG